MRRHPSSFSNWWLAVVAVSLGLFVACAGPYGSDGTCNDYEPIEGYCDDNAEYVCQTTEEGCRQCSCIPTGESHRFR